MKLLQVPKGKLCQHEHTADLAFADRNGLHTGRMRPLPHFLTMLLPSRDEEHVACLSIVEWSPSTVFTYLGSRIKEAG